MDQLLPLRNNHSLSVSAPLPGARVGRSRCVVRSISFAEEADRNERTPLSFRKKLIDPSDRSMLVTNAVGSIDQTNQCCWIDRLDPSLLLDRSNRSINAIGSAGSRPINAAGSIDEKSERKNRIGVLYRTSWPRSRLHASSASRPIA